MGKVVRTTKMPAKPKYKPLPKAPSMSASVQAWEAYKKRVQAVIKYNLAKQADYDRKVRAIKSVADMKKRIRESIKKARKSVPFGRAGSNSPAFG